MANAQPDPKAVAVANLLQKATGADCIVLFGSRARSDWTTGSDLDVMVLNDSMPDQATILETQATAAQIADYTFGWTVTVDVLFMTHRDFAQMSEPTINHVAGRVRKAGIPLPRNPGDYSSMFDDEYEQNEQLEYQERERRIADANVHYRNMHGLLDLGFEDKDTAFLAQQAVESAFKGLISALGENTIPTNPPGPSHATSGDWTPAVSGTSLAIWANSTTLAGPADTGPSSPQFKTTVRWPTTSPTT